MQMSSVWVRFPTLYFSAVVTSYHLVIRALGKMIIGHLNLIRLVLLAVLLSITVGRILPGEGI